eukprot:scaffold1402_cov254-Pinguiococcus_pyrenoidosus.AAC.15
MAREARTRIGPKELVGTLILPSLAGEQHAGQALSAASVQVWAPDAGIVHAQPKVHSRPWSDARTECVAGPRTTQTELPQKSVGQRSGSFRVKDS